MLGVTHAILAALICRKGTLIYLDGNLFKNINNFLMALPL
jgi:hypothetical protein